MGFFNFLGKETPKSNAPYLLDVDFHPLRLPAHKADYLELILNVTNNTNAAQLMSVFIHVPKGLGFDQSTLSQDKEVRLETVDAGANKKITVKLWSAQRTQPGNYSVQISVAGHYRTYKHILNEVKKTIVIRVV